MASREDRIATVRGRVERSRFNPWVGMRLERIADGEADFSLDVRPEHLNLMGGLHGGVISSLADTATGVAMHSALDDGWTHVTTSLHVTFLASGREDDRVLARGRVLRRGRRFGYAEADVERADGSLLARASATFLIQPESAEDQPGR